jgi:membrane associated rhomboid family serine protease
VCIPDHVCRYAFVGAGIVFIVVAGLLFASIGIFAKQVQAIAYTLAVGGALAGVGIGLIYQKRWARRVLAVLA